MVADWPWVPFVIDLELAIFRGSMLGFDKLSFKAQTAKTLQQLLVNCLIKCVKTRYQGLAINKGCLNKSLLSNLREVA